MMNQLFQSMSLRSRIYLTAGLLVGVCCIASGIGLFGQAALLDSFEAYEMTERTSSQVLEIDRKVQKLKSKSEQYIQSGSESARVASDRLLKEILSKTNETRLPNGDPKFNALLDQMNVHLTTFGEQLELASKERAIRSSIVNEQLPKKVEDVHAALSELRSAVNQESDPTTQSQLLMTLQAFGEGRMHLLQYLIHPGAERIDQMLEALHRADQTASQIGATTSTPMQTFADRLQDSIADFQQLALRTIQATRGYMFYSNVVMAGEISEFVYYSNQVKDFVHRQQELNRQARSAAAGRTRALSIVASLAALLFAGLAATNLCYAIVQPLSGLTDAFRRLSAGETMDHIPGSDRQDEIGRMSRAAQVFSAKNKETKELLSRSQALSVELVEKAKALEETNLELDNFAYVASHDLKAPLRGIRSLAEWVNEDSSDMLTDESKRHLGMMHDRVDRMQKLLDELLEYSRVGRMDQSTDVVDLEELVNSIFCMIENPEETKCIIGTPLPTIRTAVAPLRQVLLNLIGNALKYNDKGKDGRIEVCCQDFGDWLSLSVEDNGMGVDPRHKDRIFKMFQRVAPKKIDGTGMGLAIVKKQVEYFGGVISLDSTPGVGSTFTFTWPKSQCDVDKTPSTMEPAGIATAT